MSTVIAGNSTAKTNIERVSVLVIMLIGVLMVSFATGSFTNYIEAKDRYN